MSNNRKTGGMQLPKELIEEVREGKFDESRICSISFVDFEVPAGMSKQETVEYQVQTIQPRIAVLSAANMRFQVLNQLYRSSNLECERYYQDLYKDICEHEYTWFHVIFKVNTTQPQHCERSTGILGTLCTLLRQRGDLEACMSIMPMYTRVLGRYQQMSAREPVDPGQVFCCDGLTYKYHLIRINAGQQLDDRDMTVASFRQAVDYELSPDCPFDKHWWNLLTTMTGLPEDHRLSSDAEIYQLLRNTKEDVKPPQNLQLRKCGHCMKEEEMLGDYSLCSRCSKVPYCSRKCQTKGWKVHKILCGANNTTNVSTKNLEKSALNLTENYAKTVLCHSGQVVTNKQKKAAIPGVLKLFKDLLKNKMPDFNSDAGLADADSDPAYNYAMNAYFQEQRGYEFLVEFHTRPEVHDLIQSRASSSTLRVGEGVIQDQAQALVHALCVPLGSAVNSTQKDQLLDVTQSMMSKYVIAHPEYNSYRGFSTLMSSKDFQAKFMELVFRILNDA